MILLIKNNPVSNSLTLILDFKYFSFNDIVELQGILDSEERSIREKLILKYDSYKFNLFSG